MPDDTENLLRRLIGGDNEAASEILDLVTTPRLLVAAAVLADEDSGLLDRAATNATTGRDRQLVAVAAAHLADAADLFDALVRDHLADHPDDILAAWVAAEHARPSQATTHQS